MQWLGSEPLYDAKGCSRRVNAKKCQKIKNCGECDEEKLTAQIAILVISYR